MITYSCDVCKKYFNSMDELLRFRVFKKGKQATKTHDKSITSKDVCLKCYKKIFDKEVKNGR